MRMTRVYRWMLLGASGGVVFQFAGCGYSLLSYVASEAGRLAGYSFYAAVQSAVYQAFGLTTA